MDEPIGKMEDDEFSLKGEVQEFTKYLLGRNTSTNLIVSIQAPWGEGKSSFLNLVKGELDNNKDETVQVIPFNPWQFSGHQDLLQQFFAAFAESKGISDEFKSTLSSIGSLANLTALVPGLELVSLIGKVLDKGADFANSIPKENIQKLREQAKLAAKEQSQHYIFLVDELDRLESHEVRAFLQMIKAVADFPNTTYVLAYDVEALEDLLKESKVRNPSAYLEKIIGYPYSLPSINTDDLQRHHLTEINDILGKQNLETIDFDRWSTIEVYDALPNLRQCKRHVAHFEFLCRSIGKYVDTTDLAYVSIIQLLDPMLWRTIGEAQNWFAGSSCRETRVHKGLMKLRGECIECGNESLWKIVCIVYHKANDIPLDGMNNDLLFSNLSLKNKPIRALSSISFKVFHTRKPNSKWSNIETEILKRIFRGEGDKERISSLLNKFHDECLVWVRHFITDNHEYDDFKVQYFMPFFLGALEDSVKANVNIVDAYMFDVPKIINLACDDMGFNEAVHQGNVLTEEIYLLAPLFYTIQIKSSYALKRVGRSKMEIQDSLMSRHKLFWKNIQSIIKHPFLWVAFDHYLTVTEGKTLVASDKLLEWEEGGEAFYLTPVVLPHVLLLASAAYSHVASIKSGNEINHIIDAWKLVLSVEPNFETLLMKVEAIEHKKEPKHIQESIQQWLGLSKDVLENKANH